MKNIDGKKIIEVLIKLYAEQNNVEAVIEDEKKPTENSGLTKNN
jgi:hypothetical protein